MCDGNNGRPDLKGRVLVGYDSNQKDYNAIGNIGCLSHVSLKTEELPEHTHTDSGHTHFVSLIFGSDNIDDADADADDQCDQIWRFFTTLEKI